MNCGLSPQAVSQGLLGNSNRWDMRESGPEHLPSPHVWKDRRSGTADTTTRPSQYQTQNHQPDADQGLSTLPSPCGEDACHQECCLDKSLDLRAAGAQKLSGPHPTPRGLDRLHGAGSVLVRHELRAGSTPQVTGSKLPLP